ncbi:hypothetical protein D9M68_711770 [compost metagenome]
MRHHARDQAQFEGARGVEGVAGEHQLHGLGLADGAREQPGAAVAGHDADLDEALGKGGFLRGDADVAHAGEVEPRAEGGAVDGGDHGHVEVVERLGQALDAVAVFLADHFGRQVFFLVALHVFHVATRAEHGAFAGEHDDADAAVARDVGAGLHDLVDGGVAGERVARCGLAHGEREDGAIARGLQKRGGGHAESPWVSCVVVRAFTPGRWWRG